MVVGFRRKIIEYIYIFVVVQFLLVTKKEIYEKLTRSKKEIVLIDSFRRKKIFFGSCFCNINFAGLV